MKKLIHHIKKRLLSGFLIMIPLYVTYKIIMFLLSTIDKLFAKRINEFIQQYFENSEAIPGIGIILAILLIYTIGMLGSSVIIKKAIRIGENLLTKIPLIKPIYSSVKQLVDALSMSSATSFRQAVYVEYPKKDVFVLGFLTNEFNDESGKDYLSVFVPTTPNPTSGFLLFYPRADVIPAGITVDEAFKAIMSGAIVFDGNVPMVKNPLPKKKKNLLDELN